MYLIPLQFLFFLATLFLSHLRTEGEWHFKTYNNTIFSFESKKYKTQLWLRVEFSIHLQIELLITRCVFKEIEWHICTHRLIHLTLHDIKCHVKYTPYSSGIRTQVQIQSQTLLVKFAMYISLCFGRRRP